MSRTLPSRALAVAGAGLLVVLGGGAAAWAAPSTEVIQGQHLRIVSVADWQAASNLDAVGAVPWDLSISADAPEPGIVSIGVRASGGTPLVIDVLHCAQAWEASGCRPGAETLRAAWDPPRDSSLIPVLSMTDAETAHLRLVIALGEGRAAEPTTIHVQADGAAETIIAGPDGPLPATGLPAEIPRLLAVGAGVLILIALLMIVAGRRRESSSEGDA